MQSDGTVEVPAQTVPMSAFLSPEAKAYVTQHLIDMQNPEILKQDAGVPRFMKGYLARDYQLFAVDKKDQKVGGVHVVCLHAEIRSLSEEQGQSPDQSSWRRIFRLLARLRGTRIYSCFRAGRD